MIKLTGLKAEDPKEISLLKSVDAITSIDRFEYFEYSKTWVHKEPNKECKVLKCKHRDLDSGKLCNFEVGNYWFPVYNHIGNHLNI